MKRIAIVDCRADKEAIQSLESYGYTVIPTVTLDFLYDAIASHADIQIHYLGHDRFVCAPEVYEYYKEALPSQCIVIKGSQPLGSVYPEDIPYNAAAVGETLICSTRSTAIEILREYNCTTRNILNVAQGYAKCSICVVSGRAIITADNGIETAAKKNGLDVLKISEGCIKLKGMEYGFIGGASGLIAADTIAFNGETETHTDGKEIRSFCEKHGVRVIELKKGDLTDIGSVICNI